MKYTIFLFITLLLFSSCTNKQVVPPSTEFVQDRIRTSDGTAIDIVSAKYIEFFNAIKNTRSRLNTKEQYIYTLALSPNEKYLAVSSKFENTNSITLYDYKTKTILSTSKLDVKDIKKIEFSSDNKYIIIASVNTLSILSSDKLIKKIAFKAIKPHAVAMIKDKDKYQIFSAGFDKKISLHTYDEKKNRTSLIKEYELEYRLKYLSYNEEKKELIVCGESTKVRIFTSELQEVKSLELAFIPHRLRLSRDSKRLFIAGGRFSSYAVSYRTIDYELFY